MQLIHGENYIPLLLFLKLFF